MPPITLYFLQASRCIRTAWLLEELGLDYDVKFSERENRVAPASFKQSSGNPLGKFPTLKDGDMTLYESGAISQYLCETYDKSYQLLPTTQPARNSVTQWVHAAEATFFMHAIGILYTRWSDADAAAIEKVEARMSVNVQKDMDWLEAELNESNGRFLMGDRVTAADCNMHFSAQFILARQLGTGGKTWKRVQEWIDACEATEGYKRAVQKSGYKL
ncbi:hypothetical protein LTR66_007964 [Elasticomyces elasticus]|nr:hypothetical protein LTR66_007964 [Elasticomyces elasticus]